MMKDSKYWLRSIGTVIIGFVLGYKLHFIGVILAIGITIIISTME